MKIHKSTSIVLLLSLCACTGIYYGAMETLGVHRRDIMVARFKAARMVLNARED